jgi:hypothetical protein
MQLYASNSVTWRCISSLWPFKERIYFKSYVRIQFVPHRNHFTSALQRNAVWGNSRCLLFIEKEKERKKLGGGGVAKDTTSKWGGAINKCCCSEGSQAMPASPYYSVKFKFNVKKISKKFDLWSTFFYITYIKSVRTSKETQYISDL